MTNPVWSGLNIVITAMTATITAGHILSNFHSFKSHLHKEERITENIYKIINRSCL